MSAEPPPTGPQVWSTEAIVRQVISQGTVDLAAGIHPFNTLWMGLFPNLGYAERFIDHWTGGDGPWMELSSVLDQAPFIPFVYGFSAFQEGIEQLAAILSKHYGITQENHQQHSGQMRLLRPIKHAAFDPETQTWGPRTSDYAEVVDELMRLLYSREDLISHCYHHQKDYPIFHHLLYSRSKV